MLNTFDKCSSNNTKYHIHQNIPISLTIMYNHNLKLLFEIYHKISQPTTHFQFLFFADIDLQSQVDTSLSMPATYQTLVNRAHLANQCCNLARETHRICERLVLDQHMMQQGWSAVIANHGDITQNLKNVSSSFHQTFDDFLKKRKHFMELLAG